MAAIVSLAILKIEVGFSKVCKEYVIDSLKFGSPIMIHSLGLALITYFDRLIVSNFLGIEKLGEYSVAFQLGIILSFIAQAFNKAFVPWLYGNLKINSMESHLKIVRGTYLIFLLIIVFVLIFISLLDFLIIIFAGESYRNVFNIAAIISIGSAFNAAYLTVINYVFYAEKTLELSLLTMSVAIFFIILSFILTPLLGLIGASISFAISNLLLFLSVWMLAIRSYKMPWFSMKLFIQ